MSCGYCKQFGFSQFYRSDLIFSEVSEWIPPSNESNIDNGGHSQKYALLTIILFLSISGIIIGMLLIFFFRNSIWKNDLNIIRRKGYNQLYNEVDKVEGNEDHSK